MSEDLSTLDDNLVDNDINMRYVLEFMVNFVADAITEDAICLPAIEDGERDFDQPEQNYLYQKEFNALSDDVQDQFNEVERWIKQTNEALE